MNTLRSRKAFGVIAMSLLFAIFATVVISNSFADTARGDDDDDDRKIENSRGKGDPHKPAEPEITVQSAAIARGECLVTHQKELEGPVAGVEPEFAQVFDENGDPVFDENGDEVHEPTGEFRDVLREIEIIRAISTCAQSDPDHDDFMFR